MQWWCWQQTTELESESGVGVVNRFGGAGESAWSMMPQRVSGLMERRDWRDSGQGEVQRRARLEVQKQRCRWRILKLCEQLKEGRAHFCWALFTYVSRLFGA